MKIVPNEFYHIYNQGNNKEKIFFTHAHYIYFLRLVRNKIKPISEIVSYCLMPNHFHFLIYTTETSAKIKKVGALNISFLMEAYRQILSSYTQGINKELGKTGSLFRQKTKSKLIEDKTEDYLFNVFNYIHQNPLRANLVESMEEWQYSSFKDYADLRHGSLCNKSLAFEFIGLNKENFVNESNAIADFEKVKSVFNQ